MSVTTVAQVSIPGFLEETVSSILAFLPRLVGALIILLVGWIIGRVVASLVGRIADSVELDRAVLGTPIGEMMGGSESAVSNGFGKLAAWFIYALAILAAANALAIETLSQWIATAVSYLPAFIAGLLVIVFGFIVADFLGDSIQRTEAATKTAYTGVFAAGTKMFLYFMAIVVGLDTMGVDVQILYVFARALAWGIAAAIAIGAGLAFGLGGRGYVDDNMDRWMGSARRAAPIENQQQSELSDSPGGDADD